MPPTSPLLLEGAMPPTSPLLWEGAMPPTGGGVCPGVVASLTLRA